jgi:hypothetical protein
VLFGCGGEVDGDSEPPPPHALNALIVDMSANPAINREAREVFTLIVVVVVIVAADVGQRSLMERTIERVSSALPYARHITHAHSQLCRRSHCIRDARRSRKKQAPTHALIDAQVLP